MKGMDDEGVLVTAGKVAKLLARRVSTLWTSATAVICRVSVLVSTGGYPRTRWTGSALSVPGRS